MVTERKLISFAKAAEILGMTEQGLVKHWYRKCHPTCPCRKVVMGMLDVMFGRRILYEAQVREWARQRQEKGD